MVMEEYDVLVVGSGPAGSTFARVVAEEMEVLVVDKRKQVGVPVRCGEGLGAREVVAQGLELPKHVISTEIVGAKVVGPRGEKIVWKDEETKGWVLERKAFDQWLAELATKKGARVRVYTRAIDIKKVEDGYVVKLQHGADEPYEVKARLVVSAEGMEAHIARKVGFNAIHSLYDVDTCYEYEMAPYNHENLIELYFGNNVAPRGYCLTPDTEIIAKNTVKPINAVKVGEEVLTLKGWVPVAATSERDYEGKIVRITPFLLNHTAGLTEDHLVYVWNKRNGFHWKRAGEIKRSIRGSHGDGDYLVFPIPKEENIEHIQINVPSSKYVKDGYIKENGYLRGKQLLKLKDIFKGYEVGNGRVNSGFFLMDNYIIIGIRKLETEHYKGKVYDIQSGGSFCPFFAVHNCWIFPKADKKANVGIGIGAHLLTGKKRGGLDGATPRTFLDRFIQEHSELRDASIYNDFGGVISVGAPMDSFVKDNFMVIGTAAKQVDPIHGGGIALAMEAGALAGKAALRAFYEKNFTSDFLYKHYEKPWRETAGKKMAKRLLLRKVLEKLNDDDLSHILSTIADSDLNQVMKGNFAGPVAKAVAGRPQLLKVLSALLG